MHTPPDFAPLLVPLWGLSPVILVGLSGATAFRAALTVLGQVMGRCRKARAALASALLGTLGAASLLVAWRRVVMRQGLFVGRPYVGPVGADEAAGLLELLDRVPPYALAQDTFGVTLAAAALLGPAARQGRGPGGRPDIKPRQGWSRRGRGDARLRGSVAALAAMELGPGRLAGETPGPSVLVGDMPVNLELAFRRADPAA